MSEGGEKAVHVVGRGWMTLRAWMGQGEGGIE